MNRLTALAILLTLTVPSTAAAAPLAELSFTVLPGTAACLGATGAPAGISMLGPYSRRQAATDLLTVADDGARPRDRVVLGRLFECAAVAEGRDGTSLVAGVTVSARFEPELRAVVRDPGGSFGAPVALTDSGSDAVAAVGPSGHAVVAWVERIGPRRVAIRAVRRAPGGALGAPETLLRWRTGSPDFPQVRLAAGIDAGGVVTLMWARELPPDDFDEHVEVATAAPGGTFAVQRLGSGVSTTGVPLVSVAADGWTLAAFKDADLPTVFERAPGGSFAAVALAPAPDRPRSESRRHVALAIRNGGGAVVAWTVTRSDDSRGVEAATREAAGAFGAIQTVATPPRPPYYDSNEIGPFFNLFDPFGGLLYDDEQPALRAALGPDGRIALAWTAPSGRSPLRAETAHAATGRLDGSFDAPQPLGASLRQTGDVAPLFLADGRAAVAWIDNADGMLAGRLHVAVEGAAAAPQPAAPRLTLRAPRTQRLFASQSPRVNAGCDRGCDLRAAIVGPAGLRGAPRTATRRGAGARRLDVGAVDGLRSGRAGRVRVVVHATVPGGGRTAVRSIRVRITRRPSLPLRRPIDVTARRVGETIVVRWRTDAPARRQTFLVAGQVRGADVSAAPANTLRWLNGGGRTRFSARLRPLPGNRVPFVAVIATSDDSDAERFVTVRVR